MYTFRSHVALIHLDYYKIHLCNMNSALRTSLVLLFTLLCQMKADKVLPQGFVYLDEYYEQVHKKTCPNSEKIREHLRYGKLFYFLVLCANMAANSIESKRLGICRILRIKKLNLLSQCPRYGRKFHRSRGERILKPESSSNDCGGCKVIVRSTEKRCRVGLLHSPLRQLPSSKSGQLFCRMGK